MQKKLLYCCFCLFVSGLHAQKTIRGKVIDAVSDEPLAFANLVFNHHPAWQTSSDINGNFIFEHTENISDVECSYIGYQKIEIAISEQSAVRIAMQRVTYDLNEVNIASGENPAHRIIRNVIRNKVRNNPEYLASFRYRCYNKLQGNLKFNGSKIDTLAWNRFVKDKHLFFMESVTERQFLAPNFSDEKVIATKVSGFKDLPIASIATDMQPFSFYEDNIKLLDAYYLNPISKGSLKKYLFKLEETFTRNTDTIFVISFRPRKNKNFDALEGLLYINSNRYAVQNVIAKTYEKSKITLRIQQQYSFLDGQYWFPEQLNFTLSASGFSNYEDVGIIAEGKSYTSDVLFGLPLQKKDFPVTSVRVDPEATSKDTAFWDQARPQKLDIKERGTYQYLDSLGQKKHFDQQFRILNKLFDQKIPLGFLDVDLQKTLQFNRYEELRVGTGIYTNEKLLKQWIFGVFLGYGQRDKAWKYGWETYFKIPRNPDFLVGYKYQDNLNEIGNYGLRCQPQSFLDFRQFIAYRFDRIRQHSSTLRFRASRSLKMNLGLQQTQFEPKYSVAVENPFSYRTSEATVSLRWAYKEKLVELLHERFSSQTPYPVVTAYFSKGLKHLFNGDWDYFKMELAVEHSFFTKNLGKSHFRLETGYINKTLPEEILFTAEGSYDKDYPLIIDNRFQTMLPYEFISDRYANLFFFHNFQNLLLKTRIFQPALTLYHNMGYGKQANGPNINWNSYLNKEHVLLESGVAINKIVKFNFRDLGYLGFGAAVFYRYGYYAFASENDNIVYKATLNFSIK